MASSVNPGNPLHITRFFPHWRMTDRSATPVNKIYRLVEIARKICIMCTQEIVK